MSEYKDYVADESDVEPSIFIQSVIGFCCVLTVIICIFLPSIIENLL